MIYDDYIAYCEEYVGKYGDRTVVLMEVGSFFEIYAVQNSHETSGADIATICDLCNLQMSRKNKAIVENSRSNPLMAGFPSFALSKHTQLLLSNHYTIVLIKQVTAPPNPKREVTEILSPSMQLCPTNSEGTWLFVAYWDTGRKLRDLRDLNVGFCGMDVSTGETWVYEVEDGSLGIDEMMRCMSVYQPQETVIIGSNTLTDADRTFILESGIGSARGVHVNWEINPQFRQIAYQNAVLRKSYTHLCSGSGTGLLSPLEVLDLERLDNVRTAFTYMIQFGYEHNSSIVQYLKKPVHLAFDMRCNLEHTSAVQLQLISAGAAAERPLCSILNRCATAFGSRAFKTRLLQPVYDINELNNRYNAIEKCMDTMDFRKIHQSLRTVLDLERIIRRMTLRTFQPADWNGFHTSLQSVLEAASAMRGDDNGLIAGVTHIMNGYTDILDINEASKYLMNDIKSNIFLQGVYSDLDSIATELTDAWNELETVTSQLNTRSECANACKIEFNDRFGHTIQVTKRRWTSISANMAQNPIKDIKSTLFQAHPISSSSTIVRVTHPWIEERSNKILRTTSALAELVCEKYKEFLGKFIEDYKTDLETIVETLAQLDITVTCARNAIDFKYIRPQINDGGDSEGSGIDVLALRHPILERLNDTIMYVPNDVKLGNKGKYGLLLFGVNSSGKSSLMKAVGLNVIMAQAGMFVAAEAFVYSPYKHIFTRIVGNDDIYRGWSTFTVEMMELRGVLTRADEYSLVLGDELCSGTESLSATAIVAAGIETLAARRSTFVFATHLHDLSRMTRITENKDVSLCHMHVECVNGELIYDRRMRAGVGSGVYGLEVCRGLDLPSDFLRRAHEIRCELSGVSPMIVDPKISRYNKNVFMDECKVCGKPPDETHHIVPQNEADKDGFIGHFHKNQGFNLIPVCEKCHDAIHSKKITVSGFVATTNGVKLKTRKSKV